MGAFGFITRTRQAASIFQANTRTFNLCRRALCSHSRQGDNIDLTEFPPELIRNFSIIAHVDHGKSTLADRLLELTGTIKKGHGQPQYLDKLQVERERGITVKAQTATMFFSHNPNGSSNILTARPQKFLLNLVDTPGHVDFNYEVSRSLAACQGVLLVVDAAQGVQAQTVANFYLAFEANLAIIPVINKIDQPTADPDRVKVQLKSLFDLDPQDALLTSAKTGEGLEHVLPAVIERIPFPKGQFDSPLRMLLLDSYYDEYKGVICHVAVVDGTLRKGEKIASAATGQTYEIMDVGILHPELTPTGLLLTGQVGYIVSGMRSTKEARVGDTLHHARTVIQPLPGFKPAKHMVFAGVYPADGSDFDALNHAIERLTCNDSSVSVAKESSGALGLGFRCGFLGLLHMDVFLQRLEQEYGAQVITTTPTVPYIFEYSDGSKVNVQNPAALSSSPGKRVIACWEPTVLATIIIPSEYVGGVMTLCSERRGEQVEYSFIDSQRALLKYRMPLREIVVDFYNELKSITSGYASFDYEDAENVFTSLFPKSQNILIYLRENAKESNKGIGPSISPFVKNIEAFQGSRSRLFGPINCRIMHMSLLANRKEEFPSNSFSTSSVTFTDLAGDMEDLHVASRDNQELVSASTSPKERADATCDNQHQQGMACDEGENDLEDLNLSENLVVEFDKVDIEMLPTVILVGRPNVGKSALFNRLIRRREALVYNTPDGHVTRDIREGVAKLGDLRFKVLDSAGLEMAATSGSVLARTAGMTANVLRSSHLAIFLIDARDGLHPLDLEVGKWLRKHAPNLRVVLALNKAEAIYDDSNGVLMAAMGEAHSLGYGDPVPISAETGAGLAELYESLRLPLEEIMAGMCKDSCVRKGNAAEDPNDKLPLQLAIVGRPNVGKSTLLNALLLEERVLTGPEPGLTRDSVRVQFEFEGRKIYLVDTAGWLQRSKVKEGPSALSAMHARRGIMRAHIVALVLDGEEIAKERSSMRHSESALARRVTEEGRGLVVVVNKMDLLKGKENAKLRAKVMKAVPQEIQTTLPQVTGIPVVFISALEGKGRAAIMRKVIESYEKWCVRLPTARLNRWLRKVMARHSWKDQASKGPKVKYFTQVKARPPTFVAFVAGSSELSETDMRFLTRSLKEDFNLGGIPIRILQRTVQRKSKADQKALSGKKSLRLACISSSDKRNVVSPCEL